MALLLPQLPNGPCYGVLAEFANPADLYRACERVRDEGFTRWDAHTPFPVHGLEKAMGLRRSPLPWIVLVMGLTGAALASAYARRSGPIRRRSRPGIPGTGCRSSGRRVPCRARSSA